jgi:hypothetical protein
MGQAGDFGNVVSAASSLGRRPERMGQIVQMPNIAQVFKDEMAGRASKQV